MWGPRNVDPYPLLKYPRAPSEHVFSFIRIMHLSTGDGSADVDKTKLNRRWKYLSKCIQILKAATSVKSLHLYVHIYNVDNFDPELRPKIKVLNALMFRILRYAANMELDKFDFHPDEGTIRSPDAMSLIERKITSMRLCHLEYGGWIDQLPNNERLASIEVHNSRIEESDEFDYKFWTTIARLENCRKVTTGDIPIPLDLNIQFRNLTALDLYLLPLHVEPVQWIYTATVIFNYMPELESLCLSSPIGLDFQQIIKTVKISDVACKKLKALDLGGYSPSGLLIAISNQCSNLTRCNFTLHDINDKDLHALSKCQSIHTFSLNTTNQITNGLAYLTRLPCLAELHIQYSLGKYIDTRLLLDFARYCPRLNTIRLSDRNSERGPSDPRLFESEDIAELFAAGAELRAYFEPRFRTTSLWDTQTQRLDEYIIRINHIRRDITILTISNGTSTFMM